MELIRYLKTQQQSCVATIGNFDGIHLGHQKILQQVTEQAFSLKLPSLVITFEPLPPEYFLKEKAPSRLLSLREKIVLLKKQYIDQVVCLRFNSTLANLPAEQFISDILVKQLRIKTLIVGDDFHFGHKRQGDLTLLQRLGKIHNFNVTHTQTVLFNNKRIGSSWVRTALAEGNLALASQLLDRPYTMGGHVLYGDQRGRQLGFPTANILLHRLVSPLSGVFAVKVHGLNQPLAGVANIGNRPTVDGKRFWLEVHLFDFNQTIYGRYLQVEFVHKIRDEQRFTSIEALKKQITQDVVTAKEILNRAS